MRLWRWFSPLTAPNWVRWSLVAGALASVLLWISGAAVPAALGFGLFAGAVVAAVLALWAVRLLRVRPYREVSGAPITRDGEELMLGVDEAVQFQASTGDEWLVLTNRNVRWTHGELRRKGIVPLRVPTWTRLPFAAVGRLVTESREEDGKRFTLRHVRLKVHTLHGRAAFDGYIDRKDVRRCLALITRGQGAHVRPPPA